MIRIGLLGGAFSVRVLLPALRAQKNVHIQKLCTAHLEKAQRLAQENDIPQATDDWRKVLAAPDIDAVVVALPPPVQGEVLRAWAGGKKHLFCEKPVGLGSQEASALANKADQAGQIHAMDFEIPEIDVWQQAKKVLAENGIGQIRQARIHWHLESYAHRHGLNDSWKTSLQGGGGALNLFGSHALHHAETFGDKIEALFCRLQPDPTLHPEDDLADAMAHISMRMESGALFQISLALNAPFGQGHSLVFNGSRGRLSLEQAPGDVIKGFTLRHQARDPDVDLTRNSQWERSLPGDGRILAGTSLLKRWLAAIEGKASVSPNLHHGARVERLMEACRQSQSQGQVMVNA